MIPFLERLSTGPAIVLDGATGTELQRRGVDISLPLWSARAMLTAPDVLRAIHADYVAAGAEIITANTFRTHARNLAADEKQPGCSEAAGLLVRAAELTRQAVEIARDAAGDRAWVAGSQAPLEDCYSPRLVPDDAELEREHAAMAENLAAAGVDLILVETQNTVREAVAACRAARSTGLPVLVSFVCGSDGRLLSGETLRAAAETVLPLGPAAPSVNCLPADAVAKALRELRAAAPQTPLGAYANVGRPDAASGWVNTDAVDPNAYAQHAHEWLQLGDHIIGGCCGTTPEHVREMRRLIDDR